MHEDHTERIETPQTEQEVVRHDYDPATERDVVRRREYDDAAPRVSEVRRTTAGPTDVGRVDTVAYDPYEGRRLAALRLSQLVYWVFGLIEGLIAIRLVLKALGANPQAGFAEFIYGITAPLVAPFVNLFANPTFQGSVLELSSIVALIVYALVAWLLGRLIWIVLGERRSAIHTRSTQTDAHL